MASNWTPEGWNAYEQRHLPSYGDAEKLGEVTATLTKFPPLVFAGEARELKKDLEGAASSALASGSLLALVGMAILAVLREGIETVVSGLQRGRV